MRLRELRRRISISALSLALAGTAAGLSTGPRLAPSTPGSLEAALETVSAEEIRADIFFIASDDLEGRDTVSPGQRVAARYIRSRLERLGVQPGGPNGGYFFEYPLQSSRLRDRETVARFASKDGKFELALGREYYFSSRPARDLDLEGPVVFCDKGSKADLSKCDLEGKWALVLDDGGLVGELERALLAQKALGAILTPSDDGKTKDYGERFSRDMTTMLARMGAQWPMRDSGAANDKYVPFLYVPRASAVQFLADLAGADKKLPKSGTQLEGVFTHQRRFAGPNGRVMAENVCGFFPGSDPVLAREVIVVSAHYDHVGYGGTGQIHNGADDNGSGTCGLMALAEALTVHGRMRRSILLMWVSGEEKGLWGSKAWTENPYLPEGCKAIANINIDMIGRNEPDKLMITPTAALGESYNGLVRLAEKVAPLEGFPRLLSCDTYWERSDHVNFARNLKIPVAFLFSDIHEDYHKPTDDPEKIDCDKIRRVVRTVLRMLDGLQDEKLDL
jgi:hypothetical protein